MRLKKAKGAANTAPAVLYSLTGEQVEVLREAAEKAPKGVYVPVTGYVSRVAGALVEGGAAEYREVPQTSDTPSLSDPSKPCRWTDFYIVPTAEGLRLLNARSAMRAK